MTKYYALIIIFLISSNTLSSQESKNIQSLKTKIIKEKSIDAKIHDYENLVKSYYNKSLDSASLYSHDLIEYSKQNNSTYGVSCGLRLLANISFYKGDYNNSLKLIDSVLYKLKPTSNEEQIKLYNTQGSCFSKLAIYDKSILTYQKAIEIAKANKLNQYLFYLYNNVALLYGRIGDNELSLNYYKEALLFSEKSELDKSSSYLNSLRLNIVNTLLELKRIEEANETLQHTIKLCKKSGDSVNLAKSNFYYGEIQKSKGNFVSAQENYKKSLKNLNKLSDTNLLLRGRAYLSSGQIHFKNKELDSALIKAHKAYDFANTLQELNLLSGSTTLLYEIYQAKNNTERVEQFNTLRIKLNDSLQKLDKSNALIKSLLNYELKRLNKEKISQLNNINNENNLKIIIISSILIIVFSVIVYIIIKSKQKKSKEKKEIEYKLGQIEASLKSDLHDNFGNRISGMISCFEILKDYLLPLNATIQNRTFFEKQLVLLENNMNTLVSDIQDILWTTEQENKSIEALVLKIDAFVLKYNTNNENNKLIDFKYTYDNNYYFLDSLTNKQILFTIKEITHNFEKYANVDLLKINFSVKNKFLEIIVEDNGVGFELENLKHINGLLNIEKRMQSIGLKTSINTNNYPGVKIVINGII